MIDGTPGGTLGSGQRIASLLSGLSFVFEPNEKSPEGAGGGSATSFTDTVTAIVSDAESESVTVTVKVCAGIDSWSRPGRDTRLI